MSETKTLKVLFVGLGNSRVAWYRACLPAMFLGVDWTGVIGTPPHIQFVTGFVEGGTKPADFTKYDVLVLQQPRGKAWVEVIKKLRSEGRTVLYELDDYVHGIANAKDHDFSAFFQAEGLRDMEMCMRECNGMLCSTEYIARRYRRYTPKTWVCPNGLDMARYRLTRPRKGEIDGRTAVTIMWAGATGHRMGVAPWIEAVDRVMKKYPHVCFASIGQDFTDRLGHHDDRVISVPFAALETYPAAMMLGDIALAPAGNTSWYKGKSTLRAMEAAALGLPVIADRHYEDAIEDGTTGYVVDHPGQVLGWLEELIERKALREEMSEAAREKANAEFDMRIRREAWKTAIMEAYDPESAYVHAA